MIKLKQKLRGIAAHLFFKLTNSSLAQSLNGQAGSGKVDERAAELLRRAAAEGSVLLKNDGTLPLTQPFALFGRVQTDTFCAGFGSGGDVRKPYQVSILQGLRNADAPLDGALAALYEQWAAAHPVKVRAWGCWEYSHPEMPLTNAQIAAAAARAQVAVVVLGRAAGEDRDVTRTRGAYELSKAERTLLARVKRAFARVVVVLNLGNLIDLAFLEDDAIAAALLIWQGGMETGNACADLLLGKRSPCGKLADCVAPHYTHSPTAAHFGGVRYNEYYEDIYLGYRYFTTFDRPMRYPFGYGLSYTQFSRQGRLEGESVRVAVKNVGAYAAKEVVTLFVRKPNAPIPTPARELIGFCKTRSLAAGEEEICTLPIALRDLAVYDEARAAWVIQAGKYAFYVGGDVCAAEYVGEWELSERVLTQCTTACAPRKPFAILTQAGDARVKTARVDLRARMLADLPVPYAQGEPCTFADVAAGTATMEAFVAQLSDVELEAISRGDYIMNSPLGASGNAGVMGGVLPSLRDKGVPPVTMTDGPSGIRLHAESSLLPIGSCLACSFDVSLLEEIYHMVGEEMVARGSDVLLAPGMNLHRDPLCGRNFEYYSEDPFLTGKLAAAAVRGIQRAGVSACPKHFACNDQEQNRSHNDSRLSERALRELHLRAFEICVTEGKPHFIMTAYNKVNGVWAHYHFALVRGILRGEWGYDGCVVTDWWMRSARCPEFPRLKVNAYRVRAGVNVLMPGGGYLGKRKSDGTLLASLGKRGGITRAELQRNAAEVLGAILKNAVLVQKITQKVTPAPLSN